MNITVTTGSLPAHLEEFAKYFEPIDTDETSESGASMTGRIKDHTEQLKKLAEDLGCNWVIGTTYHFTTTNNRSYLIATGTPVKVNTDML